MDINSIRNSTPNHETSSIASSSGSGPRNLTPSEIKVLKRHQNETHRQNLINVCRMCIKSLVDTSAFQSILDDSRHLNNFCVIVEFLFLFRLLPHKKNSWFGPEEPFTPWSVVCSFKKSGHNSHSKFDTQSVNTIEEMCVGCPPITKFRAWLRLVLLEKRFAEYYALLASNRSVISHFYESGSCFEGEIGQIISENLKCLNSIDFLLCLKDFSCPGEFNLIIDFSPYLTYQQTPESQAADELERLKVSPRGARGEPNLEELLRKEREQKLFYEEVIRSREEEIQSLQEQNSELTAERTEKQQIILELQRLLDQTQAALRESQHHQEKKTWLPNLPNMSNLTFMRGANEQAQNNAENRDNVPNSDFVSFGSYTSGKVPQDPDLWSRPLEENAIRKKANHSPNTHTPKQNSVHTSPVQHTPDEALGDAPPTNHLPQNGNPDI